MNNKTIYQVDAFTDTAFKGNPAGVMILDSLPSDIWMQQMAMEMNLSETAFVAPNAKSSFDIRYFTPTVEIPLCGHATLASAHVMYQLGIIASDELIQFKAKGGDLTISKDGDDIVMTFPQYSLSKINIPNNFKNVVGFEPIAFYKSDDNWVVAIAESQNEIEKCTPDFNALKSSGLGHLMVTSEGKYKDVDFVVRCFVPEAGINEDPVTGSAHCALTPLWANRLGKTEMVSHQISKRGGILHVALKDYNVEIKGKAVTIFEARLAI
ncbi:PhzF family phenazine biosynthesis protein [Hyunsoonleella sp. 2307UL5-6]|uniref:PhzF family phenazine biosynthesis protein n=1 Tax=Hyunsoonleella sp. 2307UL5-6 TaxID=3384768 RepID=UPI0039BD34FF